MQRADLVVGFNNLRFDYEVLHGYTSFDLRQLPTLDMLVDLQNTLAAPALARLHRHGDVRRGENGRGHAGHPMVREGKLLEIAEYCCYDVKITRLVHEYGCHHRQLHYHNRFGKKMTVPVSWAG